MFGNFRMRHGFPTRRKKDRPKQIEIGTINADGSRGVKLVPVESYPAAVFMPSFGRANILYGGFPFTDTLSWTVSSYTEAGINEFMRDNNWDGEVIIKIVPVEFARMIIKILYGFACAEIGLGKFDPICLDEILCKTNNVSHIFGQSEHDINPNTTDKVYNLNLSYIKVEHRVLVMGEFRILPGMGTPTYHAVVGEVKSEEQLAALGKQISDNDLKIVPRPFLDR